MSDVLYEKLVKHWEEVTELPPQRVGPFTPLYKAFTKRLKVVPWPAITAVSIIVVFGLYLLFGSGITAVVSMLQRGF